MMRVAVLLAVMAGACARGDACGPGRHADARSEAATAAGVCLDDYVEEVYPPGDPRHIHYHE
jgi:hypothetical protein